jgi:hypothetical protein
MATKEVYRKYAYTPRPKTPKKPLPPGNLALAGSTVSKPRSLFPLHIGIVEIAKGPFKTKKFSPTLQRIIEEWAAGRRGRLTSPNAESSLNGQPAGNLARAGTAVPKSTSLFPRHIAIVELSKPHFKTTKFACALQGIIEEWSGVRHSDPASQMDETPLKVAAAQVKQDVAKGLARQADYLRRQAAADLRTEVEV